MQQYRYGCSVCGSCSGRAGTGRRPAATAGRPPMITAEKGSEVRGGLRRWLSSLLADRRRGAESLPPAGLGLPAEQPDLLAEGRCGRCRLFGFGAGRPWQTAAALTAGFFLLWGWGRLGGPDFGLGGGGSDSGSGFRWRFRRRDCGRRVRPGQRGGPGRPAEYPTQGVGRGYPVGQLGDSPPWSAPQSTAQRVRARMSGKLCRWAIPMRGAVNP